MTRLSWLARMRHHAVRLKGQHPGVAGERVSVAELARPASSATQGCHALASAPGAGFAAVVANSDACCSVMTLAALCTIARLHQIAADPEVLTHQLGLSASDQIQTEDLLRGAKLLGLKAKLTHSTPARLSLSPLPALALLHDGRVVVLAQCDGQRVLYQAAGGVRPAIEPIESFALQWTGRLILITSRASLVGALAKFDFSWFIPSLVKHRKLLSEVLFISFMLQLFALISPLFFQVVMDKVLVHRGVTTLDCSASWRARIENPFFSNSSFSTRLENFS